MKRTAFDESRDQQIASQANDRSLMCEASGCPNRWAVQREGSRGLCSAHAWADRRLWPQITQEQIDAETDRARANAEPKQPVPHVTMETKRGILGRLRAIDFATPGHGGKAWAYALKAREDAGERLTQAQRDMWRHALRMDSE